MFINTPTTNKNGAAPRIQSASAHPLDRPTQRPDTPVAILKVIAPDFSPSARCIASVSLEILADNSV
jgi:hypothetical protein